MNYFQNSNAEKPVEIGSWKLTFEATHWNEGTGSYWGILQVEDKQLAEVLARQGVRYGVHEVSAEDADKLLQKKSQYGLEKLSNKIGGRIADKGGRVELVEEAQEPQEGEKEEALEIETILSPEDLEQEIPEQKQPEESPAPKKKRGRPPKQKTE